MIFRLDLQFLGLANYYGVVWAVVAAVCLLALTFARIDRAFLVGIALVLAGMTWFGPIAAISRVLRWWTLAILALRGVAFVTQQIRGSAGVRRIPASVITFSILMLVSCAWSDEPVLAVALATSIICVQVVGLVVIGGLSDQGLVLQRLCVGAFIAAIAIHVTGFVVSGYAVMSGDPDFLRLTGVHGRLSGVLQNANGNGVFAALFLPVVAAAPVRFVGAFARARWVIVAVLVSSIVLSGSRTAVLITLMGLGLLLLYRYRVGGGAVIALILGLGVMAFLVTPAEELEGSLADQLVVRSASLDDVGGRLERWQWGYDVAMERPILGHGWGASKTLSGQDAEASLLRGRIGRATNLHSAHISVLVDLGFVGLGAFWWLILTVLRAGMTILAAPRSDANTVAVLVFAAAVGLIGDTFVHGGVLAAASSNSILFWSATGIVVSVASQIRRARYRPAERPSSLAATT